MDSSAVSLPPVSPVRIMIDSSADGRRCAYVALVVDQGVKPRLIYGVGTTVSFLNVEGWGITRALRRVNARFGGCRPILVYTDNLRIVQTRGNQQVQYQWVPRTNRLMRHIHGAANALRRSL